MQRTLITKHLRHSVILKDVSDSELRSYAEVARVERINQGKYLYKKGDASDVFYIIAVGEVELIVSLPDKENKIVCRIGPGGHFGETGLLRSEPRSLDVRAHNDLVLICFDKRFFRSSILGHSRIHSKLDAVLANRLRFAYQAQAHRRQYYDREELNADDVMLFEDRSVQSHRLPRVVAKKNAAIRTSKTARKTQAFIDNCAENSEPYILCAEFGTGKSTIARQIHLQSSRKESPYRELDLRKDSFEHIGRKLFGEGQNFHPFAPAPKAGLFEKTSGGTLTFTHVHLMGKELQECLLGLLRNQTFTRVGSSQQHALQSRIVFLSDHNLDDLKTNKYLLPELLEIFEKQSFSVPPLCQHKEDLPRLISHYLSYYSKEYGKSVHQLPQETLGVLMNYDWPGNLKELSGVIRRAVMLSKEDKITPDQILLGLPKSEGKWEYNILRIPWVNKFLNSSIFPKVPQIIIACVLLVTILCLFFGTQDSGANIGLTMGWTIGWPLMFFSFFFLARIWCSVCPLATPGSLLQNIIKPYKRAPAFIKQYSGWIMAVLCILVFWVEIVWNAYENPYLTGGILLVISFGSIIFSALFSRRAWCRYICPLGAVNAIFSMPAILELRANQHVCLKQCRNHSCFAGDAVSPGCPMFRHPYLVDNNRDCIMCGKCIKNCSNGSIQLNVRLAPEELWGQGTPRKADSFLIVSMGAILFPFALNAKFSELTVQLVSFSARNGLVISDYIAASILFFGLIILFQVGYFLLVEAQCLVVKMNKKLFRPLLGYGFIPLILGGYLAFHLEIFIRGARRIVPNIREILDLTYSYQNLRLISQDSTDVLKTLIVGGGLLAAFYATYKIVERAKQETEVRALDLLLPFSFLSVFAGAFCYMT